MDRIFEIIDDWLARRSFVVNRAKRISAANLDWEIYQAARWARSGLLSTSDFDYDGMRFAEFYSKILYADVLPSQIIKGLSLDRKKEIQESFNKRIIDQRRWNLRACAEFYRKLTLTIIGVIIFVAYILFAKTHGS